MHPDEGAVGTVRLDICTIETINLRGGGGGSAHPTWCWLPLSTPGQSLTTAR